MKTRERTLLRRSPTFPKAWPAFGVDHATQPNTGERTNKVMPELREATEFGTRIAVRRLFASLVGMVGIVFVAIRASVDRWSIAGGVVFVVAGLALAFWSAFPGRFVCPECGLRLRRPIRLVGPLQYHCPSCDVIWDTGVKQWTGGD
jgi:hypothetical protein